MAMYSTYLNEIRKGIFKKGKLGLNHETKEKESVVIALETKNGEIQVVYPYEVGLLEKIEKTFEFGQIVELEEISTVEDIKFSAYNGGITVKVFGDYKGGKNE